MILPGYLSYAWCMYIPVYVFVERSQLKCQSRIWVINMLLLGKPNGTMTLKFFSIPPLSHSILTNDNYFFKPFLDVLFSCCLGNHKNLVFRLFTFNVRTIFCVPSLLFYRLLDQIMIWALTS